MGEDSKGLGKGPEQLMTDPESSSVVLPFSTE